MIPIPPLDGSNLLFRFMSPQQAWQWRPVLQQYGFIILIAVIVSLVPACSAALITNVARVLLGI